LLLLNSSSLLGLCSRSLRLSRGSGSRGSSLSSRGRWLLGGVNLKKMTIEMEMRKERQRIGSRKEMEKL
jgi:hypothetical protein